MKKYIFGLIVLFFLVSCGESAELTKAKDELLDRSPTSEVQEEVEDSSSERKEDTMISGQVIQIIPKTELQYLDFDSISESDISNGEIILSGKAESDVEKIQVLFSNGSSNFPDDNYTLQTYSPGSESFKYVASSKNKVLDFGKNEYVFRAYKGKEYSETQLIIIYNQEKETSGAETKLIGGEYDTLLIDLPTSSRYGDPVQLGESSFTYSDIKGLEVSKEILPELNCENLTEFLGDRVDSWYYWNTCREVVKDKGLRFNVIRLDGENYVYERHYADLENGLYATYELETGDGVDKDNIAEKNSELKEKEYETTDLVDDLIRDIITS